MLDSFNSTVWQDSEPPTDGANVDILGFPMAVDPFLSETCRTSCPPQRQWSDSPADGCPYENQPLNLTAWMHETLLFDSDHFLQGLPGSSSLESPEWFWLTGNDNFIERIDAAVERSDGRANFSSQTRPNSTSATEGPNALMVDDHGSASLETCPITSLSSFSSLGLSPNILCSPTPSQPASSDSSSSGGWTDNGSIKDSPIWYFGDSQSWGSSQRVSASSAWYNNSLIDKHEVENPAQKMHSVSNDVPTYADGPICRQRDDANIVIATTHSKASTNSFVVSLMEGALTPYSYTSGQTMEYPNYKEPASSLDSSPDNHIGYWNKIQSSFCIPLSSSSNSVRPPDHSDDGKGLFLNRSNCTPHSNMQVRGRLERCPLSPGSIRGKASRQRPRPSHIPTETHMIKSTKRTGVAPSATPSNSQRRWSKDAFLVRSKVAGMSYKDIKARGNFSEAESTLRGRFRALTKNRKQRVRKPEWTDRDIELLLAAVEALAEDSSSSHVSVSFADRAKEPSKPPKIPWKKVADCITSRGGSYHFGNATCRKKWDQIRPKE